MAPPTGHGAFEQQRDQRIVALGRAVPRLAGGAQQRPDLRAGQPWRTQALPEWQKAQVYRNIRLHAKRAQNHLIALREYCAKQAWLNLSSGLIT
jgi:hypothetical protein